MAFSFDENKFNGELAEKIAIDDFREQGFTITKTGIGSDFFATKELSNGLLYQIYVEVKYNTAKLSDLQKKQKFLAKKHNIEFFEYRVTLEFLEHYKKENNIKMEYFDEEKQTIVYPIESSDNTKSRIRLPWTCPNCKETSAESQSELIQKFGVRKMHGIVHNQSWCRRCRCS